MEVKSRGMRSTLIECDARLEIGVAEIEEADEVGSYGLGMNGFVVRIVQKGMFRR